MLGFGLIGPVAAEVRRDVAAARSRDPAARGVGSLQILATWPGVHALLAHRVAHALHEAGVPLLPRVLAAVSRAITGIEIHPAARIGQGLFIDHGMGVVIGETAEVGDDVTLYQGVTLGGTSLTRGAKRHPTIGNGVIVSSGAQVLGPFRVGDGARIGAQAVVLSEVPDGATMVGIPARPVGRRSDATQTEPAFQPYAVCGDIPDPIARALSGLLDEVTSLTARVTELEQERAAQRPGLDPASAEPPSLRLVASSGGNGTDSD